MSILLAILLLTIYVLLARKNMVWGIAILVVLLPSYLWRLSFFGWPSTFLELLIWALFITWLSKDKLYKRINYSLDAKSENKINKIWRVLLLLWLLISFFSAAITNFSFSSLGLWRAYFLEPMMFFLVLIYNIKNKKDIYCIFRALALLLIGLFIFSVLQYFTEWNLAEAYRHPNVKRLTSVYLYPNALSLITAPLTSMFLILWLEGKNKLKNIIYFLAFLMGISLSLLAISEGGIVAIMASLFFYLILAKKIRKFGIPLIILISVITLLTFPVVDLLKNIQQQLFSPQLDLQATSLEIRSNQWQETTWMLHDNFLWGAGLDGYQAAMNSYRQYEWIETYLYPHNIFLNFWTEIGLTGLILFLIIAFYIIKTLKRLFKKNNFLAWPLTAAWLSWFVHGLVDVPYFKNDLSVLFFLLLGISLLAEQFLDYEKNKK